MPAWKSKPKAGYGRSGLEDHIIGDLTQRGVSFDYETLKVPYVVPESNHKYTPDFILVNGIIVESKGIWDAADRKKIKLVKEQHPDLDIRMLFSRSSSKISKNSKSTYADVCRKLGLPFADAPTAVMRRKGALIIPQEWIDEPPCPIRLAAIEKLKKR